MAFDRKSYNRQWKRANSAKYRAQYKARRDKWLKENGPCRFCGAWSHLVVDHVDPKTKTRKASSIWRMNEENAKKELIKCQVLCFECHTEKTAKENQKERV